MFLCLVIIVKLSSIFQTAFFVGGKNRTPHGNKRVPTKGLGGSVYVISVGEPGYGGMRVVVVLSFSLCGFLFCFAFEFLDR